MDMSRRSAPLDRAREWQPAPPAVQRARWLWRVLLAVGWTLPGMAVQSLLLLLPGDGKRWFARVYWAGICRVLGVERRVIGRVADIGRPVLFACNHTSWLDVPVLGGTLEACFVAKAEVGTWPVVRTVARLGRTVFVSRRASETARERDSMRARLLDGDDLILFPEGTSSDGTRVLSFRSPFFAIVERAIVEGAIVEGAIAEGNVKPLIQPVSVVFDRLDYLPARRSTRPVTSWYGDMDLGSHFWRLARYRHMRATIVLHDPVDPADYPSRKAVAQAVWQIVSDGNAALRRGRLPVVTASALSLDMATPNIARVVSP